MKAFSLRIIAVLLLPGYIFPAEAQYNWKLSKDKDGIKIYESSRANSDFKSIRVDCTFQGNYDKFIAVLNNISHYKDWVYQTKTAYLLKRVSPNEFYYYVETSIPWPMSNRDAIMHVKMERDSLNRFLKVGTTTEPHFISEKSGIVRVPYSLLNWYLTMPTTNTIHIVYILEVDPGGSLPAWLVNMFADKGPFETFERLAEVLKK